MSDFSDTLKYAIEHGILLDSCGESERQYWWGLYNDLCGMSVEDALKVQYYHQDGSIDPDKKTNIINFVMQKGTDGEYTLYLIPKYAPTTPVMASFSVDGVPNTVTIPAGSTSFNTGIKSTEDPTKPYAEISNASFVADDPSYNYAGKNSVSNGVFKLTIDNDGEIIVEEVKYGTPVTLPTVPEREGYTFAWKDSKGEVITGTTIEMPEADFSIHGEYTVNQYNLSFSVTEEYFEDGTIKTRTYSAGTVSVNYGEKVLNYIKSYAPSRVGMTVDGWELQDGTDIDANYTMPAEDIAVVNKYTLNTYELKYLVDGAVFHTDTLYYGQEIEAIEEPSKVGYTFNGWDKTIPATMPAENLTVNAKFTAINYYIYYKVNGETLYTEEHHYQDAISIRADEVKEGYTFAWEPSSLPQAMPAEDITVVGTFTAIDYTFKCVSDGAIVVERTYHFEDTIEPVEDPSKIGYEFTGWNPSIPTTMPSHDVTCEAQFEAIDYTITYEVDGAVISAYTETHHYGDAISIRADEEKEGYTFSGWEPSSLPSTMPAENITVVGSFAINQYTLTYYVGGTLYSAETYDFGAAIVAIDEPSQEGYTFSGWDEIPATMPSHDVDVNGEFTINTYTITYELDGEAYSSETYEYNEVIVPIEEPSKEGYTFSGWSEIPERMPAEDVTITGELTINRHTITYLVSGETYSAETYDFNEVIVPIEAPSFVGYHFTEWGGIVERMPDYDIEVEAIYEINVWTATYKIKSGETYTTYTSVTYEYGETIVDPVPQEIPGYTFAWDEHAETMPDNDIIINGEYTEIVESTMIYHNILQYDITSAITPEIMSASESYDGKEENEKVVNPTIEADEQCVEWARLRDIELDAYDEDGEEYHVELADEYQGYIDEYAASPEARYGFVFAVPSTLTLTHLLGSIGEEKTVETLNTITIDDTDYTVYRYAPDNNAFRQYDQPTRHEFTIIVE